MHLTVLLCALLAVIAQAQEKLPEIQADGAMPTFGTTVVAPSGFCGEVSFLREGTQDLPNFDKMKPVGAIFTSRLYVPPRAWTDGFPGVTKRFEWFAIDYRARFWIETPGKYTFWLLSDDGAKLYIDQKTVIDNDGTHAPRALAGFAKLSGGIHNIRVTYFQGPQTNVALVLGVLKPGEGTDRLRVFDTNEFRPPLNPAEWKYSADAAPDVRKRKWKGANRDGAVEHGCPASR